MHASSLGRTFVARRRLLLVLFSVPAVLLALAVPAEAKPAPSTTITGGPSGVTNSTNATFTFTSSVNGATFACSLDGAAAVSCTSPASYTGLAEGSHTFTVASTASGVTEAAPPKTTWTIDLTPPTAPSNLAASTPTSKSVALSWQAGTDKNGVAQNQIFRDGALLTTVSAVTSYTDTTVAAASTHTYAVRAVDGAGNISPLSNSVSATTPGSNPAPGTVIDSGPASLTNAIGATFAFHSTISGATFACALDTAKPATCTSPKTYSGLASGAHTFTVAATAGGVTDPNPPKNTWTIDTTAPSVPTGLTVSSTTATSATLNWAASTDTTGVTGYDVYRGGTLLASLGTATSYTDTGLTTGATYRYAVRARDGAGNTSALTTTVSATPTGQYDSHLTRAPYLTDLVGSHVAINFATDQSQTTASAKYGAVDASGNCSPSTNVVPRRVTIQVGSVSEYQWTAEVDLPSTGTYCYRVYLGSTDLLGNNSSPQFTTQVPVGATSPFTFDVLGDWGQVDSNGTNPDQANLMTQIASSGARFLVSVGDNGYPNGSQINYGDLQQTGADTSALFGPKFWTVPGSSIPMFNGVGNHGLSGTAHTDITTWTQDNAVSTSGGRYQNDVYCCVNGTSSANYGSEWYAFNAGNARFYVLDSAWGDTNGGSANPYANDAAAHFAPGDPEYNWLVNDLQTHPTQLKFVFSHYPMYSDNNTQPSDTYLDGAGNLEGLLAQYGVQIVFNGHAHIYERNTASAAGMPITYVTGGGGATLEPMGTCGSYDAYAIGWSPTNLTGSSCGKAGPPGAAANVYHFLKVTVSGTSVTVTPTDSQGNTFDVQTYNFKAPSDTYIDSAPSAGATSSTATFAFHASGSPATFACRLDGGAATACTSPVTYTGLAQGKHTFTVAATVNKQADPTPAQASWTVDSTPPSAPSNLSATTPSPFGVDLSWSAATDNTGVTGYRIYRDGTPYRTVGAVTNFSDNVVGSSTHQYAVSALDVAGNESPQSAPLSVTTDPAPAPVFADGFESGDLSAWTASAGLTVQKAIVNSGSYAAEGNTTNGNTFAKKNLSATYPDGYARVVVDVVANSSQINLLRLRDAAGNSLAYVYVDNSGHLGVHNDALGTNTLSGQTLTPGWHAVELHVSADTPAGTATGTLQVWLDNSLVGDLSSTSVDVGAAPVSSLQIGDVQTGRTYDVVFDDAAFGTSRLGPVGDSAPPSTPTGLAARTPSGFEADLTWDASNDDSGVAGYDMFRDGAKLATVIGTSYTDTNVLPGTTYHYAVRARDFAGNTSTLSDPIPVTTPSASTPMFADGFETGDGSAWTSSTGLTVENREVGTGTYSAEANTTSGATWAKKTLLGSYTAGYARVAFDVISQSAQVTLLRLRDTPTGKGGYVYLTAGGHLAFRSDTLTAGTVSSVVPGSGWHDLELYLNVNSAASVAQVWLDGTPVGDLTFPAIDLGTAPLGVLQIGDTTTTGSWDVLFDDAAFSTSRIGPAADGVPPTVPGNLAATTPSGFEADLTWDASSDDAAVTGYDVFRDGAKIATVTGTSYPDTTVLANSTHQYAVRALDASGNVSALTDAVTVTMPDAATPVFADGFETGDLSAWTTSGGLTAEGTDVHMGSYAAEGNTTTGATYAKKTLATGYDDAYARVSFLVKSQTSQLNLLRLRGGDGTSIGYVYLDTSHRLGFHDDATNTNTTSTVIPDGGWHVLELHLGISTGMVEVWLDGGAVAALDASGVNLGTAQVGGFQIGETTTARTYDVVFDDAGFGSGRLGVS